MGELFMLKNLVPDPRCVTKRGMWAPTSGSTVKQLESGLYQYKGPSGSMFAITVWGSNNPSSVAVGDIVFAKFSPGDTIMGVESSSSVLSGDGWIAARRNQTTNVTLQFNPDTAVTLERCAHYTPETWEKVREMYENGSLELPYFDYKTMPLGGGVFVLALSLLVLSAAISGGWRHERADDDPQLVSGPVSDRCEGEMRTGERDSGIQDVSIPDGKRQSGEGRVLRGDVDHERVTRRRGADRVREIRRVGSYGCIHPDHRHVSGLEETRRIRVCHGRYGHLQGIVYRAAGRRHQVSIVRAEQGRGGYGVFASHDHRESDVRPDQRADRLEHGIRLRPDALPERLTLGVVE